MKIYSLVFDYDINKMKASGRPWADSAYKNRDFIFEYSAASISTFLHHNPHLEYEILTDDVDLLSRKIDDYRVSKRNLRVIDATAQISSWTSHWYSFWPLIASFDFQIERSENGVLKLDNDLTCLGPVDSLLDHDGAIVWKRERNCKDGRDYWGEKYAAQRAFGTDNFNIYNTGTWGISSRFSSAARSIPQLCEKMISIDISSVSKFPESPGLKSSVFNTSDQVSNCYFLSSENVPVIESNRFFEHHCYGHDAKKDCIEKARSLRNENF
jgi:hypothetical protein